jgi:translocation and assembly module TamA
MRALPLLTFSLLALVTPSYGKAAVTELCNVRIESTEGIDFSGTEESWLCGEKDSEAWQRIPIPQKRLFLTGFLQERGYHNPEFRVEDGILHVNAGAPAHVERFTVKNAPKELDHSKRRRLIGNTLNKNALDDAANWTRRQLQYLGYPCPKVTPLALTDSNEIQLDVNAGPKTNFSIVESQVPRDLHPGVIDRFTAFRETQPFDIRLLELTSSRILLEDLYLSSYYDVLCADNEPPKVVRRFVPAKPRLLTFGVGFSTEEGPLFRARFKWTRIDTPANSLETDLTASFRIQELSSRFRYHLSPEVAPNLELVPNISFAHEETAAFEALRAQAGANLAYTWEREDFQIRGEAGPSLNYSRNLEGVGPADVTAVRVNSRVNASSHLYEFYQSDPRTGWTAGLETQSQFKGLLADQTFHRVLVRHKILFNLGHFDPAFLIFGWRGQAGTYLFNNRNEAPRDIPADQRFYLGGIENLRGFKLNNLPGDAAGYVTSFYQGFELRTGTWFSIDVQPFIFFDIGMGGRRSLQLNNNFFYAPGVGVRYASPFGTVRASLAKGYATGLEEKDPQPGLQFFFSFGPEF